MTRRNITWPGAVPKLSGGEMAVMNDTTAARARHVSDSKAVAQAEPRIPPPEVAEAVDVPAALTPEGGPAPPLADEVPISAARVEICLASAEHWARTLPQFADLNQRWADFWAIATGIVGALTSLAVWPAFSDDSPAVAKVLVSLGAMATAICQLIPRVRNHAEVAGQAKEIASQYGSLVGRLTDLREAKVPPGKGHGLLADFQTTKAKKDSLRRVPVRTRA